MPADVLSYLRLMVEKGASDVFFSVGTPPHIKIEGMTSRIDAPALEPGDVKALAASIMSPKQMAQFETAMEMNLSLPVRDLGRFRVNVYRQRGETAMVIRYIKSKIPDFATLSLPPILERLTMMKRGLVLVVGATGSGKSTTLAAMIDYRNRRVPGHILCIEDPIEYLHDHKLAVVDQREVGLDTTSYAEALKNAMRQAPDVICIGEIRDRETMQHAIAYSETGHLCISTLHSNNANQAIERIINFFPEDARKQLLMDLSINLQAVVSQRLVPGVGARQVPAVEVMLLSPLMSDLIQSGRIDDMKPVMARSTELGMCTFDQSLFELYQAGKISMEEALRNADSQTDLKLKIKLTQPLMSGTPGLETIIDSGGRSHRK